MVYNDAGQLLSWNGETFHSADPGKWNACVLGSDLIQVDSAGNETVVMTSPSPSDCLAAARANTGMGSGTLGYTPQAGYGYYVRLLMASNYNGVTGWAVAARTPTVHFS
jgi:hypothetical protein